MRKSAGVALLIALVAFSACGGGGGGVSIPFPFSPGTAWSYRHIQGTQQGTAVSTYRGQQIYRGMNLHKADLTSTLLPATLSSTYFEWSGCAATRAIVVVTTTAQLELVLDRAVGLSCGPISISGSLQIYLNGSFQGTAPWSASSSDGGEWLVTVPSGTYRTRRWNTLLALAGRPELTSAGANYIDRNHVTVLSDSQDGLGNQSRLEHVSGPVTSLQLELRASDLLGGMPPLLIELRRALAER
jgi:hypothetical protein